MKLEVGKLYRLVSEDYGRLAADGYLWVLVKSTGHTSGLGLHKFKSVVTGRQRALLYPEEAFEGVEDDGEG